MCLHALSSFQRTDCVRDSTPEPPARPGRPADKLSFRSAISSIRDPVRRPWISCSEFPPTALVIARKARRVSAATCLGEPSEVTYPFPPCQAFFASLSKKICWQSSSRVYPACRVVLRACVLGRRFLDLLRNDSRIQQRFRRTERSGSIPYRCAGVKSARSTTVHRGTKSLAREHQTTTRLSATSGMDALNQDQQMGHENTKTRKTSKGLVRSCSRGQD